MVIPIVLLFVLGSNTCEGASWETVKSLKDRLLSNYSTDIRPINNQSDVIRVEMNMHLTDIVELNEIQQTLTILAVFTLRWSDEFLAWDPSEFDGIKDIQVDQDKVWIPRINLWGNMDSADLFEEVRYRLSVRHDGWLTWNPARKITVTCYMDVVYFPFDTQHCKMAFTPLLYNTDQVKLTHVEESVNSSRLKEHGEWKFINSNYSSLDFDLDGFNMSVLYVQLEFKRLTLFFVQNFLVPIIIISFLNLLTFWLPDGSGEKASFAITVLLALTFYLTSVSNYLPQTSTEPVYITTYITYLLVIGCLTVFTSVILIYHHHKQQAHIETIDDEDDGKDDSDENVGERFNKNLCKILKKIRCKNNKSRKGGFTIDVFLFLVFFVTWVSVTTWFLASLFVTDH